MFLHAKTLPPATAAPNVIVTGSTQTNLLINWMKNNARVNHQCLICIFVIILLSFSKYKQKIS